MREFVAAVVLLLAGAGIGFAAGAAWAMERARRWVEEGFRRQASDVERFVQTARFVRMAFHPEGFSVEDLRAAGLDEEADLEERRRRGQEGGANG